MRKFLISVALFLGLSTAAQAENLYQVSLLRAGPGLLGELIEYTKQQRNDSKGQMLVLRHNWGDHWDIMILQPTKAGMPEAHSYQKYVDFQHDFLTKSETDWKTFMAESEDANMFHVEMTSATAGDYQALLKQRQGESIYKANSNRRPNHVFETVFGIDVDVFTLGVYKDLPEFAVDPGMTEEELDKAAQKGGFKNSSEIGLVMRQSLTTHQDTLASQIK